MKFLAFIFPALALLSFSLTVMSIAMLYEFYDIRNFNFLYWGVWGFFHIGPLIDYLRYGTCRTFNKVQVLQRYRTASLLGICLAYLAYFLYMISLFGGSFYACTVAYKFGRPYVKHCRRRNDWLLIYFFVTCAIGAVQWVVTKKAIKYAQEELDQADQVGFAET